MIANIFKKIVGSRNDRLVKSYRKIVAKINAVESDFQQLTDEALKNKTDEFKRRHQGGESLDQLLVEAFATVREAARRQLGMRHFDVQLIGGITMHQGKVAEMRTGEGKTLMATLALYLNALAGKGVHLITVNDYLAERDANWMRPVYESLGLTLGINLTGMETDAKQAAYAADVTYGTNNEFGFDYLRDNMVFDNEQRVQRDLFFSVVDEVDSILIDEARTPLIISGHIEESTERYQQVNQLVPQLVRQMEEEDVKGEKQIAEEDRGDYTLDEKTKHAHLTEQGHKKVESILQGMGLLSDGESLYDLKNIALMHYVNAAIRAHTLFQRDVDYIVKDGKVIIVDEHTGRLMDGRRWSDGLHQAVEAKEGVPVELENQTMASITFQNYFRLYNKLAGMTGTADTEAFELRKIYGLEVVVIPTNKPMVRDDRADLVYLTQKEKYQAIVEEIKQCQEKQQPVLVGTASIESSELLSQLLQRAGIAHEVLNAKQHGREAKIIAQAGRPGAVTIATNMAGRGTDIVLGGNLEAELAEHDGLDDAKKQQLQQAWQQRQDQVLAAGGLHVLGSERHESRRIDNQLRGRSGRQGDVGSSQFYLSMEDNLMRIFSGERMSNMLKRLGVKEGDVIQHPWINRAIENAQRRVEGYNFDVRKQLLEFDDVANDQRKVVYLQRAQVLEVDDISDSIKGLFEDALHNLVNEYVAPESMEDQWDITGLERKLHDDFRADIDLSAWLETDASVDNEAIYEKVFDQVWSAYQQKCQRYSEEMMRGLERHVLLGSLDTHWREHLAAMDYLRKGIHLRGYAQKNPTQEFKRESFDMFSDMLLGIKHDVCSTLSLAEFEQPDVQPAPVVNMSYQHAEVEQPGIVSEPESSDTSQPFVRNVPKVGRNDACPCGSGKKYKQCHGRI